MSDDQGGQVIQISSRTKAKKATEEGICSSFLFDGHDVRVQVGEHGELWFAAKDVAKALDIAWSSQTLSKIKDGWKGVMNLITPGGQQEIISINEAAVYKLAFRSNKQNAEKFTDWVVEEVLPALRKAGSYSLHERGAPGLADYQTTASQLKASHVAARAYKGLAKMLGCSESVANAQVVQFLKREMDLDASPLLLENIATEQDPLVIATDLGQELGLSSRQINQLLEEIGLQRRIERKPGKYKWELTLLGRDYGQIIDVGKKHSDGTPVQQIKWYKSKTLTKLKEYKPGVEI